MYCGKYVKKIQKNLSTNLVMDALILRISNHVFCEEFNYKVTVIELITRLFL